MRESQGELDLVGCDVGIPSTLDRGTESGGSRAEGCPGNAKGAHGVVEDGADAIGGGVFARAGCCEEAEIRSAILSIWSRAAKSAKSNPSQHQNIKRAPSLGESWRTKGIAMEAHPEVAQLL
jgi:hypothetical protein